MNLLLVSIVTLFLYIIYVYLAIADIIYPKLNVIDFGLDFFLDLFCIVNKITKDLFRVISLPKRYGRTLIAYIFITQHSFLLTVALATLKTISKNGNNSYTIKVFIVQIFNWNS